MTRWNRWGWYQKRAPKRPAPQHGIKVRKIGATWWGQRWAEALEKLSWEYTNRLARGRTYARAGRVHDLEVEPGRVTARVTGSSPRPYTVTIRMAALDRKAWGRAIAAMAEQAIYSAELLAGQMPKEIDRAFAAAGTSIFPVRAKDLATECSCPDWANPCKHVAATHYVLGEAFDRDPFLLFELRGRGRDAVLGALRKLRAGAGRDVDEIRPLGAAIPAVSLADRVPEDYERLRAPIANLSFRIEPPAVTAALLRQLGTPPSWSESEPPHVLLAPLYSRAGALARDLALRPGGTREPGVAAAQAPLTPLPAARAPRTRAARAGRSPRRSRGS